MPEPRQDSALEQRITAAAKIAAPIAVVVGAIAAGVVQGAGMAILVLAGGALVATVAIFWGSVRTLIGEAPLAAADAYAMSAPRAEEEQKRAVLRALKDLEYERNVGKISEEDFRVLTQKYRSQAKELLRQIDRDREPQRARVEVLVEQRLRKEGLLDGPSAEHTPSEETKADEATTSAGISCRSCGTTNDADAVFCKKCGERCAATEEQAS